MYTATEALSSNVTPLGMCPKKPLSIAPYPNLPSVNPNQC